VVKIVSGGLITNSGRKIMLDRTYSAVPTRSEVTQFKIGSDDTTATVLDTDMGNPIPIAGTESVDDCETADWTDSADMTTSLNSTTYKEGSNSLNLTKDGSASATASTYKTTTSRDFTSKELSIWVYIKDATALTKLATSNCLTIRFGSGAGDYYEWQKDKADLAVGWNLIDNLTSSNSDSTTGSPSLSAMDYTYVGLTATGAGITWSVGDFAMDDIKVISSDDYTKLFESGYPIIDYTNLQVEIRCRISTVEANGYSISEMGLFNTDGTPLMKSRDVFDSISKTDTDEIVFVIKTLIE